MSTILSAIVLLPLIASLLPFICILCVALRWPKHHEKDDPKLPPGPRALPIIGNLHLLGFRPHQSLYHLAKEYGHIMFLRLGKVETVVVSSAQAAELFLKTHDTVFANRPQILASHYLSYGTKGMIFDDYSPYWRNVRKVCTLHLLSGSKVESFAPTRKEELNLLVETIKKAAEVQELVDVSEQVGDMNENLICRMIFGKRRNDKFDLRSLIKESLDLVGAVNIADYVPFLGALDLQGLTRRMKAYRKDMDKVLEKIIDDHEQDDRWQTKEQKDFIDALLSLMNQTKNSNGDDPAYVIDRTCIKAIIQDIINGGRDRFAKANLFGFGGERKLKATSTLPLIPRKCVEDITVNGYHIPKNSRILVNAWAIGRDCNAWLDNAEEFFPERFKDTSIDLRGRHFQLIPFGSGRRGCPGMLLGLTNVRLVVAQLVHCFNWELVFPYDLDMTEKYALTTLRATHLSAVPTYRLPVKHP
ncbi:hypothetical protein GH714_043269 [Hevea brasiliensis]|uniref:Cytochrome P450 n=1 Tax=Hevea brasiliensis TaxID=3981 RepID=A0A6A6K2J2_HEVBR|nr:hypothetical protein GH714_043269 [Hevea brasiliensis]